MQQKAITKTLLAIGMAPFFAHAIDSSKDSFQPATNGQYIVVLKSPAKNSVMTAEGFNSLQADFVNNQALTVQNSIPDAQIGKKFHHLINGFVVKTSKKQAEKLAQKPNVAYVEPDYIVSVAPTEQGTVTNYSLKQAEDADWGLSRLNARNLSDVEKGSYSSENDGSGVTAYVVDSGVNYNHQEFGERASVYIKQSGLFGGGEYEKNPRSSRSDFSDCNGHGTHVAATIGGITTGVANNVNIVGVKVLNCKGQGPISDIVDGLQEVDYLNSQSTQPGVVNMSLGGLGHSEALKEAVDTLVGDGITVVVAAGNLGAITQDQINQQKYENPDACVGDPASYDDSITVGASDEQDSRAGYSYFGRCTDIFAPGSNILSAFKGSDHAYQKESGTSMASPHVAGVVAQYLSENPNLTPSEIKKLLIKNSTQGVLDMNPQDSYLYSTKDGAGLELPVLNEESLAAQTRNRLLYVKP